MVDPSFWSTSSKQDPGRLEDQALLTRESFIMSQAFVKNAFDLRNLNNKSSVPCQNPTTNGRWAWSRNFGPAAVIWKLAPCKSSKARRPGICVLKPSRCNSLTPTNCIIAPLDSSCLLLRCPILVFRLSHHLSALCKPYNSRFSQTPCDAFLVAFSTFYDTQIATSPCRPDS